MADTKVVVAKKIEFAGVVQGIGFRPFVYRLAQAYRLSGSVKNISGSVEILAVGEPSAIDSFLAELLHRPPIHARIEDVRISDISVFTANGFTVEASGDEAAGPRFFSTDLAVCADCRDEIFDVSNRRYRHYFNTCVSCGPRFSVMKAFPYDRENTSMDDFAMCPDCGNEYARPSDRRFHAETIACNACGPALLYRNNDVLLTGDDAFREAVDDIKKSNIVAFKGIGGYHLACSPYDSAPIARLREQKGRECKPFAIMFRDIAEIRRVCTMSDDERELLLSPAHPIVLLRMHRQPFAEGALCESGRCGCFLPYTPLHELIMAEVPCLIMTSANVSDSPIIKDDHDIFSFPYAVLYHDRTIVRGVEDSVAQTVCSGKTQMIRRARGYVPQTLDFENPSNRGIIAMGGDLKAAFSLAAGRFVTMSQYFGDLENAEVLEEYQKSIAEYIHLFEIKPEQIVCDSHPRYFSGQIAERLARRFDIPILRVLHHHAHIASVMAEHRLSGKVIGVAFDGTGYGGDGHIWGGEFLVCEDDRCTRVGHLEYTALLGADHAARDARKTAACFLHKGGILSDHPERKTIADALALNINTFLSSGVGRLFDAVASIIGICHRNSYEGQCASALQYYAEEALESGLAPVPMSFLLEERNNELIVLQNEIINLAYSDSKAIDFSSGAFALGFHLALADMVCRVCQSIRNKERITQTALSGGVFQNSLLLSLCADKLAQSGFSVYYNSAVPPNDGGLALGQSFIAARRS